MDTYLSFLSSMWAQLAVHQTNSSICETVDVIYHMQPVHQQPDPSGSLHFIWCCMMSLEPQGFPVMLLWQNRLGLITLRVLNTLRPRQNGRQMILSNAFSWMKILEFRLKFHWSLFLRVLLTIFQHWFWKWLGAVQATSYCLNQCWLAYWCIYASLCLNELSQNITG